MVNKKALSNLVAYVLLIGMTMALAGMVFGWLKFYVRGDDILSCPDNVNLVINSYKCIGGTSVEVEVKNKGFFDVDGYIVRVNDKMDAEFGLYKVGEYSGTILTGEGVTESYSISWPSITLIEIQPIIKSENGEDIYCENRASQKVSSC